MEFDVGHVQLMQLHPRRIYYQERLLHVIVTMLLVVVFWVSSMYMLVLFMPLVDYYN